MATPNSFTQPTTNGSPDAARTPPTGPSYQNEEAAQANPVRREQLPLDLIDEESMESFPCSDPPSYSTCHA